MIPLTVLRRLDCVLEATNDKVLAEYKRLKAEGKYDAETIEKTINRKFKLNFHNTSGFTLFFDQIQEEAVESEDLKKAAAANTKDDFRYVFEKAFEGLVIDRMDGNEEIFGKLMADGEFRKLAVENLLDKVYRALRKSGNRLAQAARPLG